MTEQIRITLNDKQEVEKVERNIKGEWEVAESSSTGSGGGARTLSGGCGEGTANCPPRAGYIVYEIAGQCYYFPC